MCHAQSPAPFSPGPCWRLAARHSEQCLAPGALLWTHGRTELLGTGSWGRGLRGGGLGAGAKGRRKAGGKEDEDEEG